ncbi:MAG: MarR family transcriptional regulator [Candidatus Limnocylindria bacterium]
MTITTTSGSDDTLTSEIIDGLAPLLAHHRRAWAARCHAHGLSMAGFGVLALLEMHGSLPMSRIAEELDVALPNATGIIGRLAERGIVERSHDILDRRVVLVGLTDAGRELIGEMERSRRERITRLIATMDDRQLRRLAASVRDLNQAARQIAAAEESIA